MDSIHPSRYFQVLQFCINPLVVVPRAPITIAIMVTLCSIGLSIPEKSRVTYPFVRILSVLLCGQPGEQNRQFCKFSLFCWLLLGLVVWPRLGDPFVSQNPKRVLWVSFYRTDSELCIYHLFVWSNWNLLHNSQWITLPIQSCQVLYSFCANLLRLLIMWVITSSLLPHYLRPLFCYVLSILAVIWFVIMALFYAAIRRDSVSFLRFSFLSHLHFFSCDMSLVGRLKRP